MFTLKHKLIAGTTTLLLVTAAVFFYFTGIKPEAGAQETQTVQAKKQDIKIFVSADGKAVYSLINLKFNGNGVLQELFVEEGQKVVKGDVLARLDPRNLTNQVKQAQANYNGAVAKLKKLKTGSSSADKNAKEVAVNNAEQNLAVQQELYDFKLSQFNEGKLSEGELLSEKLKLENAKGQLDSAKALLTQAETVDTNDIAAAQESVNQMAAALAIAKNNLSDAVLTAPQDGVIFAINGKVGELIAGSSGSDAGGNTGFIVLADSGNMTVEASVFEDDIAKVKVGQEAEVTFSAMQDDIFTGKVKTIYPNPQVDQNGIVTYKVAVTLDSDDVRIKNGLTAGVSFILEQVKDVVSVPVEAVKRVGRSPAVEVRKSDGSTNMSKVKTGMTDGKAVEIIEGLEPGTSVLIRKSGETMDD